MKSQAKTVISMGEILWDLLPGGAVLGGAPFNFAYRMHTLGYTSWMVSRLGEDDYGKRARQQLQEWKMEDRFISQDREHPTGTVDILLDERNQPDYTINPHVAYDSMECTDELLEAASRADCICFGTLAQRHSVSRRTIHTVVDHAQRAVKLLDINLRKECYDQESITSSLQKADVLKLNHEEVTVLKPMLRIEADGMVDFAQALIRRYPLELCIMTLGAEGVIAVSGSGEIVYEPGFRVELEDPCGSGDAFTAAFMHQWFQQQSLRQCCRFGNALGAMVATHAGATTLIQPADIEIFIAHPPERVVHSAYRIDSPS